MCAQLSKFQWICSLLQLLIRLTTCQFNGISSVVVHVCDTSVVSINQTSVLSINPYLQTCICLCVQTFKTFFVRGYHLLDVKARRLIVTTKITNFYLYSKFLYSKYVYTYTYQLQPIHIMTAFSKLVLSVAGWWHAHMIMFIYISNSL